MSRADRFWRALTPPATASVLATMSPIPTDSAMSAGRRRFVLSIAAIIIIGQAVDTVAQREHFPFSNYPMYAHETGPTTSLLRIYGIVTDGTRTWDMPIADSNSFAYVPEMNEMRMKNVLAFSYGKGQPKNVIATRRVLKDYLNAYEHQRVSTNSNAPRMLIAECKRLTWSVAADGMPEPTPQIETLVTTSESAPTSSP